MGIYENGTIYGIKMYQFNDDDLENVLFEEKYEEIMNHSQMNEAYLFYTMLNNKKEIHFKYYTECSSTYDTGTFLMWYPMSLKLFLEKFDK